MNESLVVIVRGIIGFFSLLIFTRFLGKQQVSQLTLFEYILGITIGSMAATLTTDLSSAAWPHWIGLLVWTILVFLVQVLTLKYPRLSEYINGRPQVLIVNGKILEKNLKKLRYSLYDLLEQLRINNIFDISQVEFAVLETNGNLTVLKKSQFQSLTPKDMNISTNYVGLSTELIYNGVVMGHNLKKVSLDEKWLDSQLKTRGIKSPLEVYLAMLNTTGELYIDLYKDHLDNSMV
ncbi:DUF421 domain-containing protein [Vallitalea longa]|uniref:DUF421 domain-containing protein n=1 Tax=Vallitalea longa TaxID=2936439 RepID=A0A9W6DFI8_9FIRM|nr:DUF421 domain-containing protein [Vallitalea longa]GKX29522.1 DUF421 domain-containing protein [Vallitalea longa]